MVNNGTGHSPGKVSQFPSELMNKLSLFKRQDASLIEGGVAGMCEPLDTTTARVS
jgi:hypothetical protein